jgi:hypothetical protein
MSILVLALLGGCVQSTYQPVMSREQRIATFCPTSGDGRGQCINYYATHPDLDPPAPTPAYQPQRNIDPAAAAILLNAMRPSPPPPVYIPPPSQSRQTNCTTSFVGSFANTTCY